MRTAQAAGVTLGVLQAVEAANERQKQVLVRKVVRHIGEEASGRVFAMWGLSFKPNTDDMREAFRVLIAKALIKRVAVGQAYDPVALDEARRVMGHMPALRLVGSQQAALEGADALPLVTEWREFKSPDFDSTKRALGIEYLGISGAALQPAAFVS